VVSLDTLGKTGDIPKVDETEHHPRDDGKVGKVEAHARSRGDGEGDVVARTDSSVESDGAGDDDVTDSTGGQRMMIDSEETAHMAADASFQLRPKATMDAACCMVPTLAPSDSQRKR
jgi:hypothetical protein